MKLYGTFVSRAMRCLWMLEEVGADYTFVPVDLAQGEHRGPEFLARNPLGKVPALVDGDLVLSESAAICTYLAEKFPEKGMIPEAGTADRARYYQWVSFAISELEQPLWTRAKHTFALPERWRIEAVKEVADHEFERPRDALAQALEGRSTLVGDCFSAADILTVHTLMWAMKWKIPLAHPHLVDYVRLHKNRPAFARMIEKCGE